MPSKAVRVRVKGRVQGVFFRESTRQEASRLGVHGWIRNLPDGSVEGVFQGPPAAVDELVAWCRRGPSAARVEDLAVEEEPLGERTAFEIRR
jgi:acylphosphatase